MATYKETIQETPAGEVDYGPEERLSDHIERFPTADEIEYLCSTLTAFDLREMATEVIIAGIEHVRGNSSRLEYATLLSTWLATAEETVAAGKAAKRIAARRKTNPQESE